MTTPTRTEFEKALNAFALHQFNRGRANTPDAQGRLYDEAAPLRARVLSLHRSRPATVPLRGEREIAEAMHDTMRRYATGVFSEPPGWWPDWEHEDKTTRSAYLATARTILARGVAWDVEKAAQQLYANVSNAGWDNLSARDQDTCRERAAAILAAATGGNDGR